MLPGEYFRDHELECHCGCGALPPRKSVEKLYALRIMLGEPLQITSAARCKTYNRKKRVGGKRGSIHLPDLDRQGASKGWGGGAFDILGDKRKQMRIFEAARAVGFLGFGFASSFIHIDDAKRDSVLYWTY